MRRATAALAAAAILAAGACREFPVEPVPAVALTPDGWPAELAVVDTAVLSVEARLEDGARLRSLPIRWSSSDPAVLSVTPLHAPDSAAAALGLGSTRARVVALRRGVAEVAVEVPAANGIAASEVRGTVRVSERWISLSAGWEHACGVTVGREAYCWGKASGAAFLGDGSSAGSALPVRVVGGLPLSAVSAGGDHTCAARPDGLLFCWGVNARGALGTGTTDDALAPTAVLL
ncbi:MAG: hypothetical protein R3362_13105, partial [Rhodothermales bacterium]|nr:hypothetical protein [Rhodothermales bacterium]